MTVTVEEAVGLCGFSRCKAPLPGSGPKGGRPYAYCPERMWPGGKSCKQLAAAQDALAEALGDEPANAELALVSSTFAEAAARITGPLGEVLASAEALRGALAAEVVAAAARVEEALSMAAAERGLREAAEAEAERAVLAEAAAAEGAARDRAERDEAVTAARAAKEAVTQANLAKARAEGIAAIEHHRAEEALRQAAAERKRANEEHTRAENALRKADAEYDRAEAALAAAVAERASAAEALAARTAEWEARAEALSEARSEVTEKLAARTAELEAARNALHEVDHRQREAKSRVDALTKALHDRDTHLAAATTASTRLTAIRAVLTTEDDALDLRTRLLSAVLEAPPAG